MYMLYTIVLEYDKNVTNKYIIKILLLTKFSIYYLIN